jgi:alpha-glucosidase
VEVVDAVTIRLNGTFTGSQPSLNFRFVFHAVSQNQLRFTIDVRGNSETTKYNRIFLRYASSPDEAVFGFGQQLTYFNQKGT